jgi:hypothetical protein
LPFGRPTIACVRASIVRETRELPGHERRLAREPTAADQHAQPLLGDDRILQLTEDVLHISQPLGQGARFLVKGTGRQLRRVAGALRTLADLVEVPVRRVFVQTRHRAPHPQPRLPNELADRTSRTPFAVDLVR